MRIIKLTLIALLAILAPIKAMAIAAISVTLVDLILGIIAAKKRGEAITSAGLKQTVIKIFVYECALVLGLVVQKYLIADSVQLVNLISTLIGCTELKSVLENLQEIYGRPFLSQLIALLTKKEDIG